MHEFCGPARALGRRGAASAMPQLQFTGLALSKAGFSHEEIEDIIRRSSLTNLRHVQPEADSENPLR